MSTAAVKSSPVNLLPLLYIGAAVIGVVVLAHYAGKIGDMFKSGADKVTKPLADAWVKATTDDIEFAPGIYFVLPNGSHVAPDDVEHVGGGKIRYLGITYKPVESLGGGRYRVARV